MAVQPVLHALRTRQTGNNNANGGLGYNGYGPYGGDGHVNWWWTPAGLAVRYAIVAGLILLLILYFVVGYWHARRRIKKGLPPLRYHRWMVRSRPNPMPAHGRPVYAYYGHPNNAGGYQMEGYPPPPPAYHNAEAPPPVYQPPPGATKAMVDQSFRETNRAGESSGSAGAGTA